MVKINKYKNVKNLDQRQRVLVQLGRLEAPNVQEDPAVNVKRKRLKRKLAVPPSVAAVVVSTDTAPVTKKKRTKRYNNEKAFKPDEEDGREISRNVHAQEEDTSEESSSKLAKISHRKEQQKQPQTLRERMSEKLAGARFRFINESLYTSSGADAMKMFEDDPEAFSVYHDGYNKQKEKWPIDPLLVIIKQLKNLPRKSVIADMGCGDGRLAEALGQQRVHSFDLVAVNDRVTACDMSKVPLDDQSVDVCVYCLSLMGTNLAEYLTEANRILKIGGSLKIMEIASRFISKKDFRRNVEKLGFLFLKEHDINDYFFQMDFEKVGKPTNKRPPGLHLKPCKYKKR